MDLKSSPISKSRNLLLIKDAKGNVLGEWVNPDRMAELKGRQDIKLLGEDFVMYRGREPEGEPYFVVSEVDFPYLKGVKGIDNVTSGSPSGPTDELLREHLGLLNKETQSHLVGFDLTSDASRKKKGVSESRSAPG